MHKRKTISVGFTIVELLIVIVVIAILAAISVIAFTGIQDRASNSAIQNDLRGLATELELFKADHGALPDPATSEIINAIKLNVAKSEYDTTAGLHTGANVYNLLYCRSNDGTRFALIARAKSGDTFQYADGSLGEYQGSVPATVNPLCNAAGILGSRPDDFERRFLLNAGTWAL